MNAPVVLTGYGGHGFVAADILLEAGYEVAGYCEEEQKLLNPFGLKWLGGERSFFSEAKNVSAFSAFIAIGDNVQREKVFAFLQSKAVNIINAIHPRSVVAKVNKIGKGVFVAANATINPCCSIGDGTVCNTSCSIDHECVVESFTHICPGTVLCGNVTIGSHCLIGANSVVKPGVTIAGNVVVAAGATVINNLLQPGIYAGTPARIIRQHIPAKERLR